MKHKSVICMLDGAVWQGTVEAGAKDGASAPATDRALCDHKQLYFESDDGEQRGMIDIESVKAIYVGNVVGPELQPSPRFFDSAPIPSSLWVRAAFVDGEVVEGMIANAWSAFSGPLLELQLPDHQVDQKQVLIPRTSIAELQVLTTR